MTQNTLLYDTKTLHCTSKIQKFSPPQQTSLKFAWVESPCLKKTDVLVVALGKNMIQNRGGEEI